MFSVFHLHFVFYNGDGEGLVKHSDKVIKRGNTFSRDVGVSSACDARPVQSQDDGPREDVGGVPELR